MEGRDVPGPKIGVGVGAEEAPAMYETRRDLLRAAARIGPLLVKTRVRNLLNRQGREEILPVGDGFNTIRLPARAEILLPPKALPSLGNSARKIREALSSPIGSEPLSELVTKSSKVTIAFDDPCVPVPPMRKPDARELIIRAVLDELRNKGVPKQSITLLCANGLHRKWTRRELSIILGSLAYGPYPLECHDAEDRENLVHLGETDDGHEVEVNRRVRDSDLLVYANVTMTSMNGGWKSVCVGLGSYRSIRHHHSPEVFGSASSILNPSAPFHRVLGKMGALIEERTGKRVFTVETAINYRLPYRIAGVHAGSVTETHRRTLEQVQRQQTAPRRKPCDVLIYGVPSLSPYAVFAGMNPVLEYNLALGYIFQAYMEQPLVKKGGTVILASPCENRFDDMHHPSYREFFERILAKTRNAAEMREDEADFASRPEYIHRYRHGHGYHGAHPFFLWSFAAHSAHHLGEVIVTHARDTAVAARLGWRPAASMEEAIRTAEDRMGGDCDMVYMPLPVVCT